MKTFFRSAGCAALIAIGALVGVLAQGPARPNQVPFTAQQADQGKAAYTQNCASCHGANLDDGQFAPALRGTPFMRQWGGKPADALYTYMATRMPPGGAGALGNPAYAAIVAYLAQSNGGQAGTTPLPTDSKTLVTLLLPGTAAKGGGGPGGGVSPYAILPKAPARANPLDKITPVTDANLQNPLAADWLTWRRTYDDLGFSPLTQINKSNVGELRVAWTWSLPNGPNEATPLVHDGVIFVHSYNDKVQALDAVTGDLLWQYSRTLPQGARASAKKAMALHDNRLFVGTSDLHMVALDVKTGAMIWDEPVFETKETGWQLTGGPLIAKGKVIVGTGGQHPGGNYIVALDLQTGKEAWRFHSIAQPGDPGGESWNGLAADKRSGASVWTPGSYDPALNLVFFGPGQTYDTGPLLHPVNQPGITNDGLYTDTTLAFNPDTGKLVWHFQHTPNDQWDLDWAFERQVIELRVNGVNRKLVLTAGKEAFYDALDAATGQYVFSFDMGLQNVIASVDPKTGAKTINPAIIPGDGETKTVCPHAGGAKSWIPGSFNPSTKILYVPMVESCMDLIPVGPGERGGLSSGVRFTIRPRLDGDGNYGRFEAVNLETKKVVWTARQHAPQTSGALATSGGLAFAGSLDRFIRAYDDTTGKVLWQTRLNDVPSSCPISYSVNGKQYIAVVVGNGGAQAATWPVLVPDIQNPPGGAAAIWVFELPEKR
jgi:alcohol dehydrogenase (cytochrome c)